MRLSMGLCVVLICGGLLVSCEARFDWPWLKNKTSEAKATGQMAVQDRPVGAFDRVTLEGMGKLILDAAVPAGTVRVAADQGVLGAIRTEVSGGLLTITEDGLQGPGHWDIEFRLAPPADLSGITLGGLGTIETTTPLRSTSPLTVTLDGMGKVDLALEAPSVKALQKGSGELKLEGTTGTLEIVAQGLGKVDAQGLDATTADVLSQGVGEVRVRAQDKLKVRAQGLGAVHFYGHPATTDIQTEGLTKVAAGE